LSVLPGLHLVYFRHSAKPTASCRFRDLQQ
jgi:hypothetical protein